MHKSALEPMERYTLWADNSGAGAKAAYIECLAYTSALLNSVFPHRIIHL